MIRTKMVVVKSYVPKEGASKSEIWLCDILNKSGMNLRQLGDGCRISKQQISNLVNGKSTLSFPMICAICYATGLDDPEEVWNALSL